MADRVEAEIPGIGRVEIKNAAQDATMQAILSVLEKANNVKATDTRRQRTETNRNTDAQKKQSEAARSAAETIEDFDKELDEARSGLDLLKDSAGAVTTQIKDYGSVLGSAALNTNESFDTVTDVIDMTADKLSGMADAAGKAGNAIPFIGGVSEAAGAAASAAITAGAGVAGFMLGQIQNIAEATDSVADAGASFGGNMLEMASTARQANLTLDEFASVVRRTAPDLIFVGETVTKGAQMVGRTIDNIDYRTRIGLRNLGVNEEKLAELAGTFISQARIAGNLELATQQGLARSTTVYVENLAKLSALSGEEIDRIAARERGAMVEQQMASTILANRDAIANFGMNAARAADQFEANFGSAGKQLFQEILAFGNVVTPESARIASANQALADAARQAATLTRQGLGQTDFTDQLVNTIGGFRGAIIDTQEALSRDLGVAGAFGLGGQFPQEIAALSSDIIGNAQRAATSINDASNEIAGAMAGGDDLAKAVNTFRTGMRDLSMSLQENVVVPMLRFSSPEIKDAIGFIDRSIRGMGDAFQNLDRLLSGEFFEDNAINADVVNITTNSIQASSNAAQADRIAVQSDNFNTTLLTALQSLAGPQYNYVINRALSVDPSQQLQVAQQDVQSQLSVMQAQQQRYQPGIQSGDQYAITQSEKLAAAIADMNKLLTAINAGIDQTARNTRPTN